MNPSNASSPENICETSLPKSDLFILPLIGLITIAACLLASEVVFRQFFARQEIGVCQMADDRIGYRYRPNCTERLKVAEGPWVTSHYNECGYRTKESCKRKPEGTTRLALIGSSVSEGLFVDDNQTISAQTADDLTQMLHRPVEVQNLGRMECLPDCSINRVDEALALKPDLLMLALMPFDLALWNPSELYGRSKSLSKPHVDPSFRDRVQAKIKYDPVVQGTMYYMIQNNPAFVKNRLNLFLREEDSGFLQSRISPVWDRRFGALDQVLAEIALKSRDAKIPFVLFEVPAMQQVQVARMQNLPIGVDADALNERLKQLATKNGISYIDTLDGFRSGPGPNDTFYVVNTHMNGKGYAIVSRILAEKLADKLTEQPGKPKNREHISALTDSAGDERLVAVGQKR